VVSRKILPAAVMLRLLYRISIGPRSKLFIAGQSV
jgi:hypothetical protein